jgi:ADP-heptose:LPS heptosyltransferase
MKALNMKKRIIASVFDATLHAVYPAMKLFESRRTSASKKILIIDHGFLGDTVISFPAVRSIRNAYPDSKITIIINPKFKELWKYEKSYDELVELEGGVKNYFSLIKKIRKEQFDIAVDLRGDIRNILLFLYASGAPVRVGFGKTGGGYLLTKNVAWPGKNEVENNIAIAEALGGEKQEYNMNIGEEELKTAKEIIQNNGIKKKIILIFPSAGYPTKEWNNKKWARVCNALGKKYSTVLSGRSDDKNIKEIIRISETKPLSFFGTLNELAALMTLSYLVIGVDTGPMHLASAAGAETIVLMGPTDTTRWKPYKNSTAITKKCHRRPCGLYRKCRKEKNKCMSQIEAEDVISLIK